MGDDEPALLRLWREKRGEIEPDDLSGNLIVQLGVATEALNRRWFERNSGQAVKEVQSRIGRLVNRWTEAELINPEKSHNETLEMGEIGERTESKSNRFNT
jgi:predicted phage-related endonuclease